MYDLFTFLLSFIFEFIRHMTGTYIKIEEAPPGTPERHVVITGSKEGCQSAAYLVQARLQEEMTRRVQQGQALSY